jgi:hypothetical protein
METSRRETAIENNTGRFRFAWAIRTLPCKLRITSIMISCLLLLFVLSYFGKADEQKTEIVIIGTPHAETESFRIQDFVEILNKVKPDVILFELPAERMTSSYEFKIIQEDSLPQQAVLEYVKQTDAKIRSYDIEGRDAFYQRINDREIQCNQELNAAINKKRLDPEAQKIFDLLMAANRKRDSIAQSEAAVINSFLSDLAVNERIWLAKEGIPEIVRLTPELKECRAFWDMSRAEWIRRNNQMITNIKRYSVEFQGQRLVVICGFEHRYYLHSHLYDWRDEPPNYAVKEYWQY